MSARKGCADSGGSADQAAAAEQTFEREIKIQGEARIVRHKWEKHPRGWYLTSTLLSEDGQPSAAEERCVVASDRAVLLREAVRHAEVIQTRAEQCRLRATSPADPATAAVGTKRKTADTVLSEPMAVAFASRTRARAGSESAAARQELAKRRADLLQQVNADPILKEQILSSQKDVATQGTVGAAAKAALNEVNMREIGSSLETLRLKCHTERGRISYQTVVAAIAGTGEHSPATPGSGDAGLANRAESFGVRFETFKDGQDRMKRSRHDLHPDEALKSGRYVYDQREERSDRMSSECLDLARRFWHNDDVSGATGTSGNGEMWRASKATDAETHPRRQIIVNRDDVYKMFLTSPDYMAFKDRMLKEDSSYSDPGRTTFLETRLIYSTTGEGANAERSMCLRKYLDEIFPNAAIFKKIPAKVVLLGCAQDAGVPQVGCACQRCESARSNPADKDCMVACLGIVDESEGKVFLVDATPNLGAQLWSLQHAEQKDADARPLDLGGILLTHAHTGHYTGLLQLGKEGADARNVPVFCTPKMASFLRDNEPWAQLTERGNISIRELQTWGTSGGSGGGSGSGDSGGGSGLASVRLTPSVSFLPVLVPHRAELSDTVAYIISMSGSSEDDSGGAASPRTATPRIDSDSAKKVMYCPDTDGWSGWTRSIRDWCEEVDVALLDATFYGKTELGDRDMSEVSHPLAQDTMKELAGCKAEVVLVHLNHTNPLFVVGSPERAQAEAAGFKVGTFGMEWTPTVERQ